MAKTNQNHADISNEDSPRLENGIKWSVEINSSWNENEVEQPSNQGKTQRKFLQGDE